ncbi:MAG: response regulator [Bdellovibrionaceae bacterium]|nr:response regulator [Pseudobdellovibrionaceae bacterium]
MLSIFARATAEVGSSLCGRQTLESLFQLVIPELADSASVWMLEDQSVLRHMASSPSSLGRFPETGHENGMEPVLRSGRAVLLENLTDEKWTEFSSGGEQLAFLRRQRVSSVLFCPLRLRHDTAGVLVFLRNAGSPAFSGEDRVIAEEIAQRAAVALDNARLYENLKITEQRLVEAKKTAEIASRAKTEFLANMSHEIRTPLGAVLGFVDLILHAPDSSENYRFWGEKIRANGTHLLGLINEILDLSKVETGHLEICPQPVDLGLLLQDVSQSFTPLTRHKSVRLTLALETPIPRWVQSDPTRLRQVLWNMIGNAVKFTEKGEVNVRLSYRSDIGQLAVLVQDTGIGLTEDQAGRLFRPFTQADSGHSRRFGGTGLGLSLSRHLCRLMDGDVTLLESEPGVGTSFLCTLGVASLGDHDWMGVLDEVTRVVSAGGAGFAASPSLRGLRLLLVEDSADNQFLVRHFLTHAGADVEVASNGEEGVQKALTGDYHLVLMDIQMPIMDGYEACRVLRGKGYQIPIVALTAHAFKEEVEKSLASGCNSHLAKPIDRHHLVRMVSHMAQAVLH